MNGCTIVSDHTDVVSQNIHKSNRIQEETSYTHTDLRHEHLIISSILLFSYKLCTPYLHNHVKIRPKYWLSVLYRQLQVFQFCPLIGRLCDPASCRLVHFPLLRGSCGEDADPWQLILNISLNWWPWEYMIQVKSSGVLQSAAASECPSVTLLYLPLWVNISN